MSNVIQIQPGHTDYDAAPLGDAYDAPDPYLASFHRGELKGLRGSNQAWRDGWQAGIIAALICVAVGAGLVVILDWWITR